MRLQTFREMLSRRPFQPVKLTLSSGQTFEIRHPRPVVNFAVNQRRHTLP